METFSSILGRRSVRRYSGREVSDEQVGRILDAAVWAPSGMNNQPWRFMALRGERKDSLAALTHYGKIISGARVAVAVFLHVPSMYNRDKDMMAAGAAVQNMLLAAWDMGLGTCWLGEIVNRRDEVRVALGLGTELEFVACVTVGYPRVASCARRKRKALSDVVVG